MQYMTPALRPRTLVLFVGDIVFFVFALWLSLYLRDFTLPTSALFIAHLEPFSLLFIAWVGVFFIAGLYEVRSIILQRRAISAALVWAQAINMIIAALFFFFVPVFGIAPKTLLVIYLVVSLVLVFVWRVILYPNLGLQKSENAIVVGTGQEVEELVHALRNALHAPAHIAAVIAPSEGPLVATIKKAIAEHNPRFIIADFNETAVASAFPELYIYLSQGVRFIDAMTLYEEVFGRVPLSVIDERWLAHNVSGYSHGLYDMLKRAMDVVIAGAGGIVSLALYPFIALAIKIEDRGPVFIRQERVGEDDAPVSVYKFRSMTGNDSGAYGVSGVTKFSVTRVGAFLRVTRLDELPQLWNIVRGDLSLIGPRPEVPTLVQKYEEEIPYYGVRHLVRPGLSGWAQLYGEHAHHGVDIDTTKNKLSYDLYYIKHRSLTLDITIVLKTIKKLLTRSGV